MTTVENVSRRGLLRAASGAALLSALPGQTWAQTARVRSEVGSPAGQAQLEVYRRAVAFLRALPTTDRRRWDAIARGHRDSCPHGNWYLLPWHREYVRQLENIVRSLPIPGAAGFALPYWDWTRAPSLPAAFRAATLPDGTPNPLWTAERGARANDGGTIPGELTDGSVMRRVYAERTYAGFGSTMPTGQTDLSSKWQRTPGVQGTLEATPHNGVHNWVGGTMRTMLSPLDPLFWLHHCNVDRIQESWRRQGNAYPANPLFADFMLRGFVSPAGGTYRRSVRNALSLGYTYDRYDPAPAVDAVLMASASGGAVAKGATPSAVARDGSAAPGQPGRPGQPGQPGRSFRAVQVAPAALGMPGTTTVDVQGTVLPPEARVRLLDILPPAVPDAPFVRVFANNPAISPDTPPEGPTYLGTVSFFGSPAQHDGLHDGHHPGEMGRFSFGLMLDGAAAAVPPGAPLQVQVVPVALDQPVQQVVVQPAAIEVVVPAS